MFKPKCFNVHHKFKSDNTSSMHFSKLSDIHQKELDIHQQNKENLRKFCELGKFNKMIQKLMITYYEHMGGILKNL